MGRGAGVDPDRRLAVAPVPRSARRFKTPLFEFEFLRRNRDEGGRFEGIAVNVVSRGFVETRMLAESLADAETAKERVRMTPLGRLGQSEDIAEVIVFLVEGRAAWVTRQNIAVDGARRGWTEKTN